MNYKTNGGCVHLDELYAKRYSDNEFLVAMNNREYRYIFSARQMGKTSLLLRAKNSLKEKGYICILLELSFKAVSFEQWCKNMIRNLGRELKIFPNNEELNNWLDKQKQFSISTYLDFIDRIVLERIKSNIYIFYDEIDIAKGFKYSIDEFLWSLKHMYEKRSTDSRYQQLTFAFSGVTTPNDLIRSNTPLNIGKAIRLSGIKQEEAEPFIEGLRNNTENSKLVLDEIIYWTGGQPFLVQQFCSKVQKGRFVTSGEEKERIEEIADFYIKRWRDREVDDPQHFKTINESFEFRKKDSSDSNTEDSSDLGITDILITYLKILEDGFVSKAEYAKNCQKLFGIGLIKEIEGKASVFCILYEKIFNKEWAEKHLDSICFWSKKIEAWCVSKKKSLLLKGKELEEFNSWASKRRLTQKQEDYKIECKIESRSRKFKKIVLCLLLVTSGVFTWASYINQLQKIGNIKSDAEASSLADSNLDRLTKILKVKKEIHGLVNNKWYFLWKETLGDLNTRISVDLSEAMYSPKEFNRFSDHDDVVLNVAISGDGNTIVSASADKTIKIWRKDGSLIQILRGHKEEVKAVAISPDGNTIVSGSANKMKIWRKDGTLFQTLKEYKVGVEAVAISSDGKTIASGSNVGTIILWDVNGNLIRTIERRSSRTRIFGSISAIAFSPDGKTIAIATQGHHLGGIELWDFNGNLIKTFRSRERPYEIVTAISFSPDGKTIVSGSLNGIIALWDVNYTLRHGQSYNAKKPIVFAGHNGAVSGVTIDPKNKAIISAGMDKTIRIWSIRTGSQIAVLEGHRDSVEDVAIAPDGETIVSASRDTTVRLWKLNNDFVKTLIGFSGLYSRSDFNARYIGIRDSYSLSKIDEWLPGQHSKETISYIPDNEIELWNRNTQDYKTIGPQDKQIGNSTHSSKDRKTVSVSSDGRLEIRGNNNCLSKTEIIFLKGNTNRSLRLAISNDSITISGGADYIVRLQDLNGNVKLIKTFENRHQDIVWAVAINRDSLTIVSQDEDGKIIFWNEDGTVKKEIEQEESRNSDPLPLKGIAISPDGKYVALASADKTIEIWDKEGKFLKTIPVVEFTPDFDGEIWDIAFNSDSKSLFSIETERLRPSSPKSNVWNLEEILKLNEQEYACKMIKDYLKHNSELEEEERSICDNIS